MSLDRVLANARSSHERLMIDTCSIARRVPGALNATTGEYADDWLPIYSGACRVKGPPAGNADPQETVVAEAEQLRTRQTIVLPHGSAAGVANGDRVQITSGPLTGFTFSIVGVVDASSMSARSLLVEQIDDPAGPPYDGDGGTPADPGTLALDGGGVS